MAALEGFERALEGVGRGVSSKELLYLVRDALKVTHAAYLAVHVPPLTRNGIYGEVTYSDEWVARYVSQNYVEIDPVLPAAKRSNIPIDWADLGRSDLRVQRFFEESLEYGVGLQGITIPIRGANGERAFFSITLDVNDAQWSVFKRQNLVNLQTISYYYHNRVLETHGIIFPDFHLTPRQIDCLRWIASGKSVQDVADILNISKFTIQSYLETARARLNALNTTHAVAKALQHGLIPPPE